MKIYFIVILIAIKSSVFAQQVKIRKATEPYKTIPTAQIVPYLDSLKTVILADTVKFNVIDLYQDGSQTRTRNGYSKLFVIDNKYSYRLDIIPGNQVREFIKEFFVPGSIETIIDYMESAGAAAIYGSRADFGAIYIQIKKGVKYNPKVGGIDPNAKPNRL